MKHGHADDCPLATGRGVWNGLCCAHITRDEALANLMERLIAPLESSVEHLIGSVGGCEIASRALATLPWRKGAT